MQMCQAKTRFSWPFLAAAGVQLSGVPPNGAGNDTAIGGIIFAGEEVNKGSIIKDVLRNPVSEISKAAVDTPWESWKLHWRSQTAKVCWQSTSLLPIAWNKVIFPAGDLLGACCHRKRVLLWRFRTLSCGKNGLGTWPRFFVVFP